MFFQFVLEWNSQVFRYGTVMPKKQYCFSFLFHVKQIDMLIGMAFENLLAK